MILRVFGLLLLMLFSSMLLADDHRSKESSCKVISKASAIAKAQRAIKGKALSASLSKGNGSPKYRVKVVLQNGRVKTIAIDGCSGRVLN